MSLTPIGLQTKEHTVKMHLSHLAGLAGLAALL